MTQQQPEAVDRLIDAEYRFLIESNADGIVVADHDGQLLFANPAAIDIFGRSRHELLGAPIGLPVLVGETAEVAIRRPDGSVVEAEMRAVGVTWSTAPAVLISLRDVSGRRELNERLRQSQKLEAIGQLTGGVAHDFNNILTVIRSCVDLLQRPDLPPERQRRYIEAIRESTERATHLTSQLLAFGRRQPLATQIFDLRDKIRDLLDMLQTVSGSQVEIAAELSPEECLVNIDPNQFATALVNMTLNSRDAMSGHGCLRFRVSRAPSMPEGMGGLSTDKPLVLFEVQDSGAGIPEAIIPRIFEPFYTTKEIGKGTGLGLSQVYGFIKQSGGDIRVESKPGFGTTFMLYFPRVTGAYASSAEQQRRMRQRDVDGAGSPAGARILIVEDNQIIGEVAEQMLKDLGYTAKWVTNAGSALEMLACPENPFDLVFSDIRMPGNMNGIDLAKEVARRWPRISILLTTGYSDVLADAMDNGFELLRKPYSVQELAQKIRSLAS